MPDLSTLTPPEMFWVKGTLGDQSWLDGNSILVSAGVAWRNPGGDGFTLPPPETENLFVDSGGYQAAVHFQDEYPYTPRELFEWAETIGADYVAGMDWACEDAKKLATGLDGVSPDDIASVEDRINRTIVDQKEQLEVYKAGNWSFEFVPVIQGQTIAQYRECARRLRLNNLARDYMGIGTVCKRDSPEQILSVVKACEDELPLTDFHLFGATKYVWKDERLRDRFRSADTHAWALKTPEGEWTANNDDKQRAFAAYERDISEIQEIDRRQTQIPELRTGPNPTDQVAYGSHECVCGTEIPPYQTDFNAGCRYCESTALNRWDAALADIENPDNPYPGDQLTDPSDESQQITLPELH